MITDKTVFISLTGKNSHKIKIPAGQGSFSIGTRGISDGKYDVMVEPDKAIIWDSFNIYFTPPWCKVQQIVHIWRLAKIFLLFRE